MTIDCNIWMICLKLNWFFYGLSRMSQFSEFVCPLSYSVWDVFNNFLLIDATERSKISSDQKRFFIALSLYPLWFFANTSFKKPLNFRSRNRFLPCFIFSLEFSIYWGDINPSSLLLFCQFPFYNLNLEGHLLLIRPRDKVV